MIPIVDTHQHLWDLTRFDLPWTRADPTYVPLARSFLLDDYAKATLGTSIERSVYMEVDAAVEQQTTEAHHVLDLCRRADTPLAAACPDTRFVLDHCGNVGLGPADLHQWRRDIEVVARAGNTVCKVSGLPVPEGPLAAAAAEVAPIVDHVLEAFGPRRVLFAGNWPVCTLHGGLARWIEALRLIVARRPEEEQRLLFHDNAVAFYALPRG